ncbi:MAG TPA: hypothetical protein VGJ27_00845 [Gaiellaceae bacterium]|jgi:hypothetical protein
MSGRGGRLLFAALAVVALALAPAALAAPAETITVVARQIDVNPGENNPCTGTTGTIVDDEQDVFHITTLADGSTRLTGHGTTSVTFTPDDPGEIAYAGHETFAFSEKSTSRTFVTTMATHLRIRGTDNTFLTIREVAHLTVSPTGVKAAFDEPMFACS